MTGRADWALELALERVLQESESLEVTSATGEALQYMRSGNGRHRRGGKGLVHRLEMARLRASEESEWRALHLLQDCHDYCTGRALKPEFEERLRLFEDGARSEANRGYVSMIFEVAVRALKDVGQLVLDRDEIQTAEDFLNGLVSQLEDGRFVHAPADRPGRYRIVRGTAEMAVWLDRIFRNRLDFEDPAEAARRVVMSPEAMTVLANEDAGIHLLKAAELKRKSSILRGVRGVIEDATATEHDLQCALQAHPWIFGGHYIGAEIRRRLVPGDEIDVPLIRSDGSLHVVELKKARGAQPIVKRHRGSWVPTAAVHDAAAQAINYLVGLDEDRVRIRREFGIETRRSSALVLIGHPAIHPEIPEETICEVLRTFNSHMSRVEVLTYKELIDSAERVLGYDSDSAAL